MKKAAQKLASFAKKHKFISIIVGLVVILFGWWMVVSFMPHPLGSGLTYLGKQDYGGPFGDSTPYSVYYYGTNMSQNEVVSHFKGAKLKRPIENKGQYIDIWLITPSGNTVLIDYYQSSQTPFYKQTNEKYVVTISNSSYAILQQNQ